MDSTRLPRSEAAFLKALRRRSFIAFLQKAWTHVTAGELVDWNWHLDAIACQLERISRGESRRLLINLPPRNGKSKTVSVIWVAYMLGVDPTLNFVCISYSNELSGKLARDCLSIMQSGWYRELFPDTVISPRRSANWDYETTRGGGRLATSVTGTLTGRGGDILILDDVIKPEEANSDTTRKSVNDWYQSTLASRLNDKRSGAIICVMQRLHQADLSGMLIEAGGWDHLSLPAIAPADAIISLTGGRVHRRCEGDVLHASREPASVLQELKDAMGSYAFQAQYQQDPVPPEGNLIRAKWLTTYGPDFDPAGYGEIVQSWDTGIKAGERNDWSVCVTALLRQKQIYILDVWRGRVEFPALRSKAVALALQFDARTLLIEDKASGQQLIQTLRADQHTGAPWPIARTPEMDKYSRVAGVSAMIEAGQLLLPREAPWLAEFVAELLAFPGGKFDDQVDALSQLLAWARLHMSQEPTIICGPIIFVCDEHGIVRSSEDADWDEFAGRLDDADSYL